LIKVGITGSIASGKSEVSKYYASLGYPVIDEDKIGHGVLKEARIKKDLVLAFGDTILMNGEIDRGALGSIVFGDATCLALLNKVVHPRMIEITLTVFEEYEKNGFFLIFLEAAILFEMTLNRYVNRILFIDASRKIRLTRLVEQRDYSIEEAKKRIRSQNVSNFKSQSDYVILNEGTLTDLHRKCDRILNRIIKSG
jgi:dephospho-CoA kinase